MTFPVRLCLSLTGLAALAALAGCSSVDVVSTATRPGKYRLFNCEQLNKRGTDLLKRGRELETLMQKAKQGPGGEVAVAIAYQNEYNINQSDLHEVEITGVDKKCDLKYRSVSERAVR